MGRSNTIPVGEVLQLQAITRGRWRALLGLPRLAPKIQEKLRPLARRVRPVGAALRAWVRHSAATARTGAFGRATKELAMLLAAYDQLGRLANEVHSLTLDALRDDPSVSASAHVASIRDVQRVQLEQRNALLVDGLGLVESVVQGLRLPKDRLADLRQEGVFGLVRALERFDPEYGVNFSSYAQWWIRNAAATPGDRIPLAPTEDDRAAAS